MGNRAVITTEEKKIGIYLHWNGGYDSVNAFLTYCKLRDFREPEDDNYGWARLCQVIGNYFGGDLSVGIDTLDCLDCKNGDNGVYIIKEWKIIGREHAPYQEQMNYDLLEFLIEIDNCQPEKERLGADYIKAHYQED
jgi:hypothetical protein